MPRQNPYPPIPSRKPPEAFSLSANAVNDKVKDFIRSHEGDVPFFYRDTGGNVTIGIGQMIPGEQEAKELPLYLYEGDSRVLRPAKKEEKIDAFRNVLTRPFGQNFGSKAFEPDASHLPNLRIQRPDREFMLEQRLRQGVRYLARQFPELETYPLPARKALQDMEFNLGEGRFNADKWKKLFPAVRNRDWTTAADESLRRIVQDDAKNKELRRNKEVRALFLEAEKLDRERKY